MQLKFYFSILLFFVGIQFGFAQTIDCASVKEGKFIALIDGKVSSTINRKGNHQVEKSGKGKLWLSVEWVDECQYLLRFTKANKQFFKKYPRFNKDRVLRVTISEVNQNGYQLGIKELDSKQANVYLFLHFAK